MDGKISKILSQLRKNLVWCFKKIQIISEQKIAILIKQCLKAELKGKAGKKKLTSGDATSSKGL